MGFFGCGGMKDPVMREIGEKIRKGLFLTDVDRYNIRIASEECGWEVEDLMMDLARIDEDPRKLEDHYLAIHRKYLGKAEDYRLSGDLVKASIYLWGSITALLKAHASRIGVHLHQWDLRDLRSVASKLSDKEERIQFHELLNCGEVLYSHAEDKDVEDDQWFRDLWSKCTKIIKEITKK